MHKIDRDADEANASAAAAVSALYRSEHLAMVRLARLIVGSAAVAEEVTHDAFVSVLERFDTIDNPGAYLRQVVVNNCRTAIRRSTMGQRKSAQLAALENGRDSELGPELDEAGTRDPSNGADAMTKVIEDRLIRALTAMAQRTTAEQDWQRVLADAERTGNSGSPPTDGDSRPITRPLAVAAALAILVGVGLLAVIGVEQNRFETDIAAGVDYVLPGEEIISEEPLVVVSAIGPEPTFDTSALGSELAFEVLDKVDDEIASLIESGQFTSPDATVTKVTLIGRVMGRPWVIVVSDGPNTVGANGADEDTNLRGRFVHSPGGGSGSGDLVPVDSLELIKLPEPGQMTNMGASYDAPTGWLQWGPLPASVAAVGFADDDRQLWMRPRAGTVVFPAQFDDGESFTLTGYAADGTVVETSSGTVSYGRDAAVTNPQVGDAVGPISGTDGAGRSFTIEPDGSPTALFFGASWCVPCRADIAAARQAVEALGGDLRLYAIPQYAEESDPWPNDLGWPHARLFPEIDSPINAVGVLPAVLILDGDNTIIFANTGFADLEESLAGFSIGQ